MLKILGLCVNIDLEVFMKEMVVFFKEEMKSQS